MAIPTQTFGNAFGPVDFTASDAAVNALLDPLFPSDNVEGTASPTTLLLRDLATGYRLTVFGSFVLAGGIVEPIGSTVTGFRISTPADDLLVQWVDLAPIPFDAFFNTDFNPVNITTLYLGIDEGFASFGAGFNDILHGRNGADLLDGGQGNDLLRGFGANDTLDGGAGNDTLFGDLGNDLVRGGDGEDSMLGAAGDDSLAGAAGNDRMFGEDGNDTLDGGDGDDSLDGWLGHDRLAGGAGQDTLRGGDGNDVLAGDDGHDLLSGQYGIDILEGGSGNDTFEASDSAQEAQISLDQKFDFLYGGPGDDVYVIDGETGWLAVGAIDRGAEAPGERVALRQSGGTGVISVPSASFSGTLLDQNGDGTPDGVGIASINAFPFGGDTSTWLFYFSTLQLGQPIAAGNYTGATRFGEETAGTPGMIVSFGTPPTGSVSGSFSIFALEASGTTVTKFGATFEQFLPTTDLPVAIRGMVAFGLDSGTIDNLVGEKPGEGFDRVLSSVSYTLPANVEALTLTGAGAISGSGNWQGNAITGNTGANGLRGFDGNDTLDGGGGADTLEGGAGDDLYLIGNLGVTVIDSGGGADRVESSVDFVLPDGVETLQLTGAAINGIGSTQSNTLLGNAQANTLVGGDGADTVYGSDGKDTLYGDGGDDQLYGESGDDLLLGGAGNDRLFMDTGNDTLDGGGGQDTAVLAGGSSQYTFGSWFGELTVAYVAGPENSTGLLRGIESVQFLSGEVVAVGSVAEFRVNSFTTGDQTSPAITALSGGGFVAAWQSNAQDGSGQGVHAQRYDATGVAQGSEFRVNTFTAGDQFRPVIADLAGGGFVVAWDSADQDGSGTGVYGQRYDAAGVAQGGEFRLNDTTFEGQSLPSIAGLPDGGFVAAWTSPDGDLTGVFARRFDASGAAQGAEFQVNSFTAGFQATPLVAALAGIGFVVAWTSSGQDGSGNGVYAQRYDATGAALGAEFRINDFTTGNQSASSIAALPDGGFVAVWTSTDEDGSAGGIYARRYDASGLAQGGVFRANTFTTGDQADASVAALSDGGFVVSWQSAGQDGSGLGVYAQRYDAGGIPQGGEFRVNTFTAGPQGGPALAALADGGFMAAWTSFGQDGSGASVHAQRFNARGDAVAAVLSGDGGANTLRWSIGQPVILNGGEGADQLYGGGGADWLDGGAGDDTLDGVLGADTLVGGEGSDFYRIAVPGVTVIDSGGSADFVQSSVDFTLPAGVEILQLVGTGMINGIGNALPNTLLGNLVANDLRGLGGNDTMGGGSSNDTLYGDAGEDQLYGEDGDDVLLGGDDYDLIFGGEGNDLIVGEAGGDIVFGQTGNDLIDGGAGTDVLFGQEDNDVIFGDAADDQIIGGSGNDTLLGERGGLSLTGGNDWIYGDTEVLSLAGGDDLINGGGGNDVIVGNGGTDVIDGGHGNDIVEGNAGTDILVGSASSVVGPETTGSDLFIYRAMTDAGDSIYGFDIRAGDNDGIDLRALFDAMGYAGTTPRTDGYLRIQQSGADALVQVDADGLANGTAFTTMITLIDRQAADITDSFFLFQ